MIMSEKEVAARRRSNLAWAGANVAIVVAGVSGHYARRPDISDRSGPDREWVLMSKIQEALRRLQKEGAGSGKKRTGDTVDQSATA